MKTLITAIVLVVGLFKSTSAVTTMSCTTDSIDFSTDVAAFNDFFVTILGQTCTAVQFSGAAGSQTASLLHSGCAFPGLDTAFVVAFVDSASNIADATLADGECTSQTGTVFTIFPTLTFSPATSTLSAELDAGVTMTGVNNNYLIGEAVSITFALPTANQAYYKIQLTTFTVTNGGASHNLVTTACKTTTAPLTTTFTGTPADSPPNSITLEFDAFLPVDANNVAVTATVTFSATVKICTNPGAACFGDGTCSDSSDALGRRRRQTEDESGVEYRTFTKNVFMFVEEESRNQFIDDMRAELGLNEATKIVEQDALCVNQTTSIVVVVILIVGMVLCVLATIWMFVKMRKSRRLRETDSSEYSYPNKSFSKGSMNN